MFKSKHSGWTWDLKRTPFGGGGGGFISSITDPISSALGTDGGNGGLLGGLAQVDKAVNNNIPGGWITVGGLAAGGLALAYAPEVMAFAEANGLTPAAASEALNIPAVNATTGEAVSAGTGLTGGAGGSTGLLSGGSTAGLTLPTGAGIAVDPAIAAGTGAGIGGTGAAVGGGVGTVGGLSAALPSAGSVGGAGAGLSAELAPGTVLGTGLQGGGAIGASYAAGANGLPATDFFGNYIPASSINTGGVPNTIAGTTGTSTNTDLLKLLKQGAGSGLSSSLGKLAQGAHPMGAEQLQVVRGNQNPFTYTQQQPIQNNTNQTLAQLLKQG